MLQLKISLIVSQQKYEKTVDMNESPAEQINLHIIQTAEPNIEEPTLTTPLTCTKCISIKTIYQLKQKYFLYNSMKMNSCIWYCKQAIKEILPYPCCGRSPPIMDQSKSKMGRTFNLLVRMNIWTVQLYARPKKCQNPSTGIFISR